MSVYSVEGQFIVGATNTLMARLTSRDATGADVGNGRNLIVQDDLEELSLAAYDLDDRTNPGPVWGPTELDKAEVIHDTIQTSWSADAIGFNFIYQLPSNVIFNGGRTYALVLRTVTSGGTVGMDRFIGPAIDLRKQGL